MGGVALPGALVALESVLWMMGSPVLPIVEVWTGPWCHYDPERTLRLGGSLWPVCSRCSGLYLGLILGPVLGLMLPWRGRVLAAVAGLSMLPVFVGLAAAFAEWAGWLSTANGTRFILGGLLTVGPAALGIVGARILGGELSRDRSVRQARRDL